jgi:hypothetical protein
MSAASGVPRPGGANMSDGQNQWTRETDALAARSRWFGRIGALNREPMPMSHQRARHAVNIPCERSRTTWHHDGAPK